MALSTLEVWVKVKEKDLPSHRQRDMARLSRTHTHTRALDATEKYEKSPANSVFLHIKWGVCRTELS